SRIRNEAASREGVVAALGSAALQLRREIGEPESSLASYNAPLQSATSSSPDALELLTLGYRRQLGKRAGSDPVLSASCAGGPELRPGASRSQHRLRQRL